MVKRLKFIYKDHKLSVIKYLHEKRTRKKTGEKEEKTKTKDHKLLEVSITTYYFQNDHQET